MPKSNLPHYNGDVTKFNAFWQSFECARHKNEHVSTINKLNYLKSLLEGQASRALEGLDSSEQNYQHAIDILKSRFGNKQQIVSAHMQALLKLQNCPNKSVEQLRRIYDNINVHVRGLKSLGSPMDHYGSLLIPIIMSRMPKEITIQVARKTSESIWNKAEILEIIHKEIEAREMGQKVKLSYSKPEQVMTSNRVRTTGGTTRSFLLKGQYERAQQTPATVSSFHAKELSKTNYQCYFCEGEHLSFQCERVTDPNKRKEILLKQKRCFICLKQGHRANSCNSNRRCRTCNNKQHQSICLKKNESQSERDKEGKDTNGSESVTATVKLDSSKQTVLLQTARANVFGQKRENKVVARILLDNGSQKTYITEGLKKNAATRRKHPGNLVEHIWIGEF